MVGDVFDKMAELEDGSVDLILTSPPFLALRSYLPADHPDKGKEIGSEATPAEFIDVLLALSAEWRRLLAPHGSLVVELGDTYSGSGGGGGDYLENGWREGQQNFAGSAAASMKESNAAHWRQKNQNNDAWPLAKSLTLTPEAYRFALAYGINPHTGQQSPAGQWRIRNVIRWVRPNPPVGALGDKFRPATSELVVACVSDKRWFDLDAVREPSQTGDRVMYQSDAHTLRPPTSRGPSDEPQSGFLANNPAGAPPLDWWKISPTGYAGAHYAVWPSELCVKPIKSMCPREVCRECGQPRRRIVSESRHSTERLALASYLESQRKQASLSVKELAAHFPSASGGATGCVWNWENAANVPTVEQWPVLKDLLLLDSRFDDLITGERDWTESTIEYEHINDHPSGTTQDATGRIYNRLPARKDRYAPDVWSDCGHADYRPGLVLDPFAGTGTTLAVAHGHGRDAIGIDIDERSAELARDRVGPLFLEVVL